MWDGKLERAIHVLDAHVIGRKRASATVETNALLVKLQAMLLDGQIVEAQKTFDAANLPREGAGDDDVEFIRALFEFHDEQLDSARVRLEGIVARARRIDPMPHAARFFLAAIAHRQERSEDSFALLTDVIRHGGDLVVARWAREQCENAVTFPNRALPESLRAPAQDKAPRRHARAKKLHLARNLRRQLLVGLALLVLYARPFRSVAGYRQEHVVLLLVFNLLVALGLHLVDYSGRTARFLGWQMLPIVGAPIVMLIATAVAATFGRRTTHHDNQTLRLLGGLYSVLPPFLVLASITAHVRTPSIQLGLTIAFAVWSLAVVMRITHAALQRPISAFYLLRLVVVAAMFGGTFLLPMHATRNVHFWFEPPTDDDEVIDTNLPVVAKANAAARAQDHDRLVFEQAEKMLAKVSTLEAGRPAFTDLYFIGAAGWADQDVFFREVSSARTLLDARFDTKGRSLILANDPIASFTGVASAHPLASVVNLRHGIHAVGKRMNRDEDILFLFVTSHGNEKGLAFHFSEQLAYDPETLQPLALKSMLDDAQIKWRVLVISGCESGVFLEPLRSPTTLVVTAAAIDRPSYGCETGNAYTEFGRALFGEVLPQERSFARAFQSAMSKIEAREKKEGILPSRPQLAEGSEIGAKLRQFEARF